MSLRSISASGLMFALVLGSAAHAQDNRRGRKYKAPPETSHIEVEVIKQTTGKPVTNAAVIFHAVDRDGHDEGNLEVKTNEDGKASIDVISIGSAVDVQVIADGFATFAQQYDVKEATRSIQVMMIKPRAQISTYQETHGMASQIPNGVQEPRRPSTAPVIEAPKPTNRTSDPNPRAPVDKDATPGNSQNGQPGTPPGVPPQL